MKEKEEEEEAAAAAPSWEGAVKEDSFPHPGKPLNQWGRELGQKRSCRGLEESTAVEFAADKTETCTEDLCSLAAVLSPRRVPAGVCGGWVLKRGLQRTDQGSGLGLAACRQHEGAGVWYVPNPGCMRKKTRLAIEAKRHC